MHHMTRPERLHVGQKGTKLTRVIRDEATGCMEEVLTTPRERGKIYLRDLSDHSRLTKG